MNLGTQDVDFPAVVLQLENKLVYNKYHQNYPVHL